MQNIEDLLAGIFKYERTASPLMGKLVEESYKQSNPGMINIRVERKRQSVCGIVPVIGTDYKNITTLYLYSAEKNWDKVGENTLPGQFLSLNDCAYVHAGVLLNCLAVLSGRKFDRLALIQVDNNNHIQEMNRRPDIAEMFLSKLSGIDADGSALPGRKPVKKTTKKAQAIVRGRNQFDLFRS